MMAVAVARAFKFECPICGLGFTFYERHRWLSHVRERHREEWRKLLSAPQRMVP
jgi:hypothetical protein